MWGTLVAVAGVGKVVMASAITGYCLYCVCATKEARKTYGPNYSWTSGDPE